LDAEKNLLRVATTDYPAYIWPLIDSNGIICSGSKEKKDAEWFRFNERKDNDQGRFLHVMSKLAGKRLTYAKLIDLGGGDSLPLPLPPQTAGAW
jgi:hypothetical protein